MSVYKEKVNVYQDTVDVNASFDIKKSAEEKQMVFGWANIAKNADGTIPLDWHGDVTTVEVLEEAAYEFALKYRATGAEHAGEVLGELVESIVFTKEKMAALNIPEGIVHEGWWVGFKIYDQDAWEKIKSGEYKMFSIQGKAKRLPM